MSTSSQHPDDDQRSRRRRGTAGSALSIPLEPREGVPWFRHDLIKNTFFHLTSPHPALKDVAGHFYSPPRLPDPTTPSPSVRLQRAASAAHRSPRRRQTVVGLAASSKGRFLPEEPGMCIGSAAAGVLAALTPQAGGSGGPESSSPYSSCYSPYALRRRSPRRILRPPPISPQGRAFYFSKGRDEEGMDEFVSSPRSEEEPEELSTRHYFSKTRTFHLLPSMEEVFEERRALAQLDAMLYRPQHNSSQQQECSKERSLESPDEESDASFGSDECDDASSTQFPTTDTLPGIPLRRSTRRDSSGPQSVFPATPTPMSQFPLTLASFDPPYYRFGEYYATSYLPQLQKSTMEAPQLIHTTDEGDTTLHPGGRRASQRNVFVPALPPHVITTLPPAMNIGPESPMFPLETLLPSHPGRPIGVADPLPDLTQRENEGDFDEGEDPTMAGAIYHKKSIDPHLEALAVTASKTVVAFASPTLEPLTANTIMKDFDRYEKNVTMTDKFESQNVTAMRRAFAMTEKERYPSPSPFPPPSCYSPPTLRPPPPAPQIRCCGEISSLHSLESTPFTPSSRNPLCRPGPGPLEESVAYEEFPHHRTPKTILPLRTFSSFRTIHSPYGNEEDVPGTTPNKLSSGRTEGGIEPYSSTLALPAEEFSAASTSISPQGRSASSTPTASLGTSAVVNGSDLLKTFSSSSPSTAANSPECSVPLPTISGGASSVGASLHPVGCKPCAFVWTKGCVNGKDCQFCHEWHLPKKKKPMKDQKNLMIIARPDGKIEFLRCTIEEALRVCY